MPHALQSIAARCGPVPKFGRMAHRWESARGEAAREHAQHV